MATIKHYIGVECRKMKPTKKHRPAIWECMLGTVYAMNDEGVIEYFDYKYDEAIAFSGVSDLTDNRLSKAITHCTWSDGKDPYLEPRTGRTVLWRLKADPKERARVKRIMERLEEDNEIQAMHSG